MLSLAPLTKYIVGRKGSGLPCFNDHYGVNIGVLLWCQYWCFIMVSISVFYLQLYRSVAYQLLPSDGARVNFSVYVSALNTTEADTPVCL